jgi:hypothetical protein
MIAGQNVALIAPRRFGKSALIAKALKQLDSKNIPSACIHMFTNPTLELLSADIVRKVEKEMALQKAPVPEAVSPLQNEWDMLENSLDFPETMAIKQQKQMICVYEDMGNILHMEEGSKLAALFKARLGKHTHTSYVFSCSHLSEIAPVLVKSRPPLVNKENLIYLGPVDNRVLIDSLNKKFSRLKLKLPSSYVKNLVKLTRGHPYYTQQVVRQVILCYVLDGKLPRQKELPDHLLRLEKDYLEKTWEAVSRNKEYVHTLLALSSGSANMYPRLQSKHINVARSQKKLEEMGLLFKNEKAGYRMADPLFELWIRKKIIPFPEKY